MIYYRINHNNDSVWYVTNRAYRITYLNCKFFISCIIEICTYVFMKTLLILIVQRVLCFTYHQSLLHSYVMSYCNIIFTYHGQFYCVWLFQLFKTFNITYWITPEIPIILSKILRNLKKNQIIEKNRFIIKYITDILWD